MSSVRQRIEHDQRHAAEKIVPTDARRVALGASGPTLSTRQRRQIADDANEIVTPSTRTAGQTGFAHGAVTRTRDRMHAEIASQPEVARPKTLEQLAGDAGLEMHERWAREAREAEQAKVAERQRREADERAAAESKRRAEALRQRKAQYELQENLVLREAEGLTPDETRVFWERLVAMNACLDAGAASVIAMDIQASRK